jgi:diacylglycerol kinase family enzyme
MPERAPIPLIVNTTAGNGCGPGTWGDMRQQFAQRGLDVKIICAGSGDELDNAARQAAGSRARVVIAAGGDGTISAIASHLVNTGVALGILPFGTLNHFARDLGLPMELDPAIDVVANGRHTSVDVGEVNGRFFINNSSLGLYPDIVLDRERQRRRLGRGKWAALVAACARAAKRYPLLWFRIDANGESLERRSPFLFIGNNDYVMQGFEIGERSNLQAGRLSLYVTQRAGRFALFLLALRALFRRLEQARDFDMLHARSLMVRTPRTYLRVATDGEVTLMPTPLHYRIWPAALRVIAPAAPQGPSQGDGR